MSLPVHTTHDDPHGEYYQYSSTTFAGFIYRNRTARGVNVGSIDGSVRWIPRSHLNQFRWYQGFNAGSGFDYSYYWE